MYIILRLRSNYLGRLARGTKNQKNCRKETGCSFVFRLDGLRLFCTVLVILPWVLEGFRVVSEVCRIRRIQQDKMYKKEIRDLTRN